MDKEPHNMDKMALVKPAMLLPFLSALLLVTAKRTGGSNFCDTIIQGTKIPP